MICKKCNQLIPDDSEFCQFCGNKIVKRDVIIDDENRNDTNIVNTEIKGANTSPIIDSMHNKIKYTKYPRIDSKALNQADNVLAEQIQVEFIHKVCLTYLRRVMIPIFCLVLIIICIITGAYMHILNNQKSHYERTIEYNKELLERNERQQDTIKQLREEISNLKNPSLTKDDVETWRDSGKKILEMHE